MNQSDNRRKLNVIISGGGTGGHIFPAIAIANALKSKVPDVNILFIGAKGKMEMEKVPAAGYPIEGLWISGLQRKLTLKNITFPLKVLSSMMKARNIINRFNPDVVIGVGGYASGPTLKVATGKGIPTVIQEQNSFPGITNKLLAKKVNKICVAYEGMDRFFPKDKIILAGNPIRKEMVEIAGKETYALSYFELVKDKPVILVIGGSQGALSINRSIHAQLSQFIENDVQMIWQTGKLYHDEALKATKNINNRNIKVVAFIDRMDYAYAAASIIVSRAGAIAISEICAVGKPAIFIPLPSASEDHQTKNAQSLVDQNAALLIKNSEAGQKLSNAVLELLGNKEKQQEMSRNLLKLAHTNATERIVDEIIALTKLNT